MATNQELGHKLDVLIRLSAIQLLGERTGAEAIVLLDRGGLDTELIADLVATSPATVRATLSRARRQGKKG